MIRTTLYMLVCLAALFFASCSRGTVEERMANAEAKLGLGDAPGAVSSYRSIARSSSDTAARLLALMRIAELYATALNDHAAAIGVYGEVIDLSPRSRAAQLARERRAELRLGQGDHEGAMEDYNILVKYFAEGDDAYRYRIAMAGGLLSAGNYRQSRLELKPLIESLETPKDVRGQALFIAAESFFLEGLSQRAAEYYHWYLSDFADSPLAPEAKMHLASCLEELGYMGLAREVASSASKDYPNRAAVDAKLKGIDDRTAKSARGLRRSGPPNPAKANEAGPAR